MQVHHVRGPLSEAAEGISEIHPGTLDTEIKEHASEAVWLPTSSSWSLYKEKVAVKVCELNESELSDIYCTQPL